jgi:hypothetical protein
MALIYVKQRGGLSRLSDSQRNANPFGKRYKFRRAAGPPGPRKDASVGLGQLAAVMLIGSLPPRRTVP